MSSLENAIVRNANCNNLNAIGLNARGADFSCSTFLGARLDESDMSGARLDGVCIDASTRFNGTNLAGVSLKDAVFIEESGKERPCRYSDLANAGAVGISAEVVAEKAAAEGRMIGGQGIQTPEAAPSQESKGPSLADILSGKTMAWSEAAMGDIGALGKPDVPDARGTGTGREDAGSRLV